MNEGGDIVDDLSIYPVAYTYSIKSVCVYMYVCVCVYVYACVCMCMYASVYVYVYVPLSLPFSLSPWLCADCDRGQPRRHVAPELLQKVGRFLGGCRLRESRVRTATYIRYNTMNMHLKKIL